MAKSEQTGPVTTIEIEITKAGIDSLRRETRVPVSAVVKKGGQVYRDVSVRFKGGLGSFQVVDAKPGMLPGIRGACRL